MKTVWVEGPTGAYPIHMGSGVSSQLPDYVPEGTHKVLIIHAPVMRERVQALREQLKGAGLEAVTAEVPDAEAAKDARVAGFCWEVLGRSAFGRDDLIIALGGGAVTDLAGFVAATWLRGVAVIHLPTTALAMVDAAIGAKTGINTEQGKNLVGSFYQPRAVLADLDVLTSLPRSELLTGLAEVVKAGFVADPGILDLMEAEPTAVLEPLSAPGREVLERAVMVKARVVSGDPLEAGQRAILNYGHTLGHAIERCERYQWRHGAAVAVGMVFAAELGALLGRIDDELVGRHRRILQGLGLPITYPSGRWSDVLEAMKRDKKARGSVLHFVVLHGVAEPVVVSGVDDSLLFAAYNALSPE